MVNHFLTGEKEKEGFLARRLIQFSGDGQKLFKKGDQNQSVTPLNQMCKVFLYVTAWEIC
jgi:hypothetical protein